MFHYPDLKWTGLQAQAIGVPQVTRRTAGAKEEELQDLLEAIRQAKGDYGLQGIYTGALASVYQKSRVEKICGSLGLKCVSPLWGVEPEFHLRRLVKEGFRALVVSVSALGLDLSWLGRVLDEQSVGELIFLGRKYRFHAGLEGGEGETFVLDCPMFREKIKVTESETHWRGDSGTFEILKACFAPKTVSLKAGVAQRQESE